MEGIRIRARASRPLFTIEDYRARALRRLPAIATAYIETGADAGSTLRSNTTAFDAWTLRQRVLVGVLLRGSRFPSPDRSWHSP